MYPCPSPMLAAAGSTPLTSPTFCAASPELPALLSTSEVFGPQPLLHGALGSRPSTPSTGCALQGHPQPSPTRASIRSMFAQLAKRRASQQEVARADLQSRKRRRVEQYGDDGIGKKLRFSKSRSLMLPQHTPPFCPRSSRRGPSAAAEAEVMEGVASRVDETVSAGGNGSSCHQCKSRRAPADLVFCRAPSHKKPKCRKKYCRSCLRKFYGVKALDAASRRRWTCPGCLDHCSCAACRRQRAKLGVKPEAMSPATSVACSLVFGDGAHGAISSFVLGKTQPGVRPAKA